MKQYTESESAITRAIRDYLKLKRIFHYKNHQGLGSAPGVSDIIGIYKKRFLAIECKSSEGKLSAHQREFLNKVNEEGGIGFVARCIEDVMAVLGEEKCEK